MRLNGNQTGLGIVLRSDGLGNVWELRGCSQNVRVFLRDKDAKTGRLNVVRGRRMQRRVVELGSSSRCSCLV